jgi:peptide/nickel transport system substrate-binding protein
MTRNEPFGLTLGTLILLVVACASPAAPASPVERSPDARPGRDPATKTITIAVSTPSPAFSLPGENRPTGGWLALTELHSEGLITSDPQSRRPIGRLAEGAPSLENGGISLLPDGRMRVQYQLRKGVTWHDGAPFTAQDLVFSYAIGGPGGIPSQLNQTTRRWHSVEAPDDFTFVVNYREPFYRGAALGPASFWPVPRHLLEEAYQQYVATSDVEALVNHPYWTTEYVHLGPFRLARIDPGEGVTLTAYEGYFLGQPKVGTVRIRVIGDANTLFASVLAGEIDLVPSYVIRGELGAQLKEQWEGSGGGTVAVVGDSVQLLVPQYRPSLQTEPAILDARVRKALYHALDREALSDAVNGRNPQLAASSFLPRDDPLFEETTGTLRPLAFDPDRAKAMMRDLGWTPGPRGTLVHASDGRPFRTHIQGTAGVEQATAAYAGYWRQIGIEVEEFIMPAARARDREYRAQYQGWETTGSDILDLLADTPATAESRWVGNPSGYENPNAQRLVAALTSSLSERDQVERIKAVGDYLVADLPFLPLYNYAVYLAVRKGVRAFDDVAGGSSDWRYGHYSRNAHVWDID